MSVNNITIVGNLGQDVEVKKKADNSDYWSINVATSERWKDKQSGELKTQTTWHKCVLYGNYANLAQYLRKGTTVAVIGKQRNERYALTDKDDNEYQYPDGKKMMTTLPFIVVQNISLVGGNPNSNSAPAAQQPAQSATPAAQQPAAQQNNDHPGNQEDLPF